MKGYYDFDGLRLKVGQQNFITNTVDVNVNNKTIKCDMFCDFEGDICFVYNGAVIPFKYVECA